MTRRRAVVSAVLTVLLAAPAEAATAPTTLYQLHDPRLDELSGIARGIASPGVFWVQNDSGDSARIFALDASTGAVRGVYRVPGAENHDWEDLAVAPDPAGRPSIWIADIGDNDANRSEVQVYRVPEPRVRGSATLAAATKRPAVWRLRYPSGPANAESLAVTPAGRAYVITKSPDGRSGVFAVPPRPDADRVQTMRQVGSIRFQRNGGLVPATLQVLATGAAMSRDGRLLAVRTYTDAYVWRVADGDVAAALRTAPERVRIPLQPQGEGVCFDGAALVLDSEHPGSPVYRVPLPNSPAPTTAPTTQPSTTAAPSPSRASSGSAAPAPDSGVSAAVVGLAVAGGVVLVTVGAALVLRSRRRR